MVDKDRGGHVLAQIVIVTVAALLAPTLVRFLGRHAFLVLALVPLIPFVWALSLTDEILDGETFRQSIPWISSLDFNIAFELDGLSWIMVLIVSGIGALVIFYCNYYFTDASRGLRSFAAYLVAFVASMLGLVLANDLLLLFLFWELTTVFSYLLIGHNAESKSSRRAAMKALMVTTAGGLAMFVGFLILGIQVGSMQISTVLEAAPRGSLITVAIGLVLIGALSKSALFPFHFWLPSAMAAPTPVSAYLHAAAMVKAGIYLMARFAPAFADISIWRPTVIIAGCLTTLIGGWQALKQTDLKLMLAFGTISQLGLMAIFFGVGTPEAAVAGLALLIAHAVFKSSLFMSVGMIDRATGTRDIRRLHGLWQAMPLLSIGLVLSALSMAAVIPTFGFVAKEAAFGSLAAEMGEGAWWPGVAFAMVFVSAILTAAYALRFVYGALSGSDGAAAPVRVRARPWLSQAPTVLLGLLGVVLGFVAIKPFVFVDPYAAEFYAGAAHEPSARETFHNEIVLWHGFTLIFTLSLVALALGGIMFWQRRRIAKLQATLPQLFNADATYHWIMRGIDRFAVEVTGATQRGSLPLYLATILITVVVVPGALLLMSPDWFGNFVWFDSPIQPFVGLIMIVAAIAAARSRRRLRAVALLGVTGYGVAILFAFNGAPDLALTQVLVETVALVFFVFAMRRLPTHFSNRPLRRSRFLRLLVGVIFGTTMAGATYVAIAARTATPISEDFAQWAYNVGGGKNIVNVVLVDVRAWDTMGEISFLVAAATGVASLVFIKRRNARIVRAGDIEGPKQVWGLDDTMTMSVRQSVLDKRESSDRTGVTWLRGGSTLAPERRSIIFEVVTRLIFHTMIIFSLYLLFAGHNRPGGGFAAGLVLGVALLVRYLAGGRYELAEALPFDAGRILGIGLMIAVGSGIAAMLFTGTMFQSEIAEFTLPVFGHVKLVTSLFFDIGVYLVVVGLMLDVLRSLGAEVDIQIEDAGEDAGDRIAGGPVDARAGAGSES